MIFLLASKIPVQQFCHLFTNLTCLALKQHNPQKQLLCRLLWRGFLPLYQGTYQGVLILLDLSAAYKFNQKTILSILTNPDIRSIAMFFLLLEWWYTAAPCWVSSGIQQGYGGYQYLVFLQFLSTHAHSSLYIPVTCIHVSSYGHPPMEFLHHNICRCVQHLV